LKKSQCKEFDVTKWLETARQNEYYIRDMDWSRDNFPTRTCKSWDFDTSTFTSTVSMDVSSILQNLN